MILIKTLLFTVLVPSTVVVLVPYFILSSSNDLRFVGLELLQYLALALVLAGVLGYFWCAWEFAVFGKGTPAFIDPPKELVVRGPYRFTRNPMYVGVLCILVGETLFFVSTPVLVYAALAFLAFHIFIVTYEEPALRRTFGVSCDRYCASVPRWFLARGRKSR